MNPLPKGISNLIGWKKKGGIGIIGSIISGILWLLIGILIGALGYHYWMKSNEANTINQTTSTVNTKLLEYEQKRRVVDDDPAQFIANNVKPESAVDYYFLARAHFLVGSFEGVQNELKKAQELLGDVEEVNRGVLENDISILLGKVDSSENKKEAEKSSKEKEKQSPASKSASETSPIEGNKVAIPPSNDN